MLKRDFVRDVLLSSLAVLLIGSAGFLTFRLSTSLRLTPPPIRPLFLVGGVLAVDIVLVAVMFGLAKAAGRNEPLWAATARRVLAAVAAIALGASILAGWRYTSTYDWMTRRTAQILGVSPNSDKPIDVAKLGAAPDCPSTVNQATCASYARAKTRGLEAISSRLRQEYAPSLFAAPPAAEPNGNTAGPKDGGVLFSCDSDDAAKCIVASAAFFICAVASDGTAIDACLFLSLAIFGILDGGGAKGGVPAGDGGSQHVGTIVGAAVAEPGNPQRLDREIQESRGVADIDSASAVLAKLPDSVMSPDAKAKALDRIKAKRESFRSQYTKECDADVLNAFVEEGKENQDVCSVKAVLASGSCARAALTPAEEANIFAAGFKQALSKLPTLKPDAVTSCR